MRRLSIWITALALSGLASACGDNGDRPGDSCAAGLLPGDLVVTEMMANPASTDEGKEWIEIFNAADQSFELEGVLLAVSKEDGSDEDRHELGVLTIEAGQYVALADVANDPMFLPDFAAYGYGDKLPLPNSGGRIAVVCQDSIVDEMLYADPVEATARAFDGGRTPDANGNDDLSLWCDAATEYEPGSFGTPGASNDFCGGQTTCTQDGVARDVIAPEVGDLIITEVHANPAAVGDEAGEWFEIWAARTVDLNGLELGKIEGEVDETVTNPECMVATEGSFIVFAHDRDAATNGGIPVVDHTFEAGLSNSASGLFIGRAGQTLDAVSWTSTDDGAAANLDPDFFDPASNDDPAVFCAATDSYGAGDLGTPGAANVECAIAPPTGQCYDGGTLRAAVPPGAGDIVISEFSANPAAVDDAAGEWIELRANAAFDLNGLEIGDETGEVLSTVLVEDCIALGAGDHVVLAREFDAAANGGLPAVAATFDFALGNTDSGIFVGIGGTVLDEIAYTTSTSGAATALDPAFADPADNDDPANWCDATSPYGDGDLGTPGAENEPCGGTPSGMCNDGGNLRATVPPALGDLVITEFMPNPNAVTDADGEWFELLVLADVDLNGLQLGQDVGTVDDTLPAGGDCIAVAAGSRVVLAHGTDMLTNGGLPAVVATFDFGLVNTDGGIFVGYADTVIDAVTYTTSATGAASSLDPASEDAVANDDPMAFCDAVDPYGVGDLGTPGAANPDCGGGMQSGMCDDGGALRAIVYPQPGEIVITEIMANPSAVGDAQGEWFELRAGAAFDLNELELSRQVVGVLTVQSTVNSATCIEVLSGDYVVFARSSDMGQNGGLPAVDRTFAFDLVNTDNGLAVGVDGTSLDEVTYASVPAGASRSLDAGVIDAVGNDNDANWCAATTTYGMGDEGTPGAANDLC